MRIITATAFTLELNIANVDQVYVQERVNGFIDKYTKKFLKQLYGDTMGNLFVDALAIEPPIDNTNRFYALATDSDLQDALGSYVYYWYQRDGVSFSSGQGEKQAQAANSVASEIGYKVSRAWNEMVEFVRNNTVDTNIFPEYVKYDWYSCGLNWNHYRYNYTNEFTKRREIYYPLNPLF